VISNLHGQPLSTRQWKHAQELLAASLSDDDWTALAEAYRGIHDLRQFQSLVGVWRLTPRLHRAAA